MDNEGLEGGQGKGQGRGGSSRGALASRYHGNRWINTGCLPKGGKG